MIQEIKDAQRWLTVTDGGCRRRIVNITDLLRHHPVEKVTDYLKEYSRETQRDLARFVEKDRTDRNIDTMLATLFRLRMAITLLEGRTARREAA